MNKATLTHSTGLPTLTLHQPCSQHSTFAALALPTYTITAHHTISHNHFTPPVQSSCSLHSLPSARPPALLQVSHVPHSNTIQHTLRPIVLQCSILSICSHHLCPLHTSALLHSTPASPTVFTCKAHCFHSRLPSAFIQACPLMLLHQLLFMHLAHCSPPVSTFATPHSHSSSCLNCIA